VSLVVVFASLEFKSVYHQRIIGVIINNCAPSIVSILQK